MNPHTPSPDASRLERLEADLPETGVKLPSLLEYLRALPTSDALILSQKLDEWTNEMAGLGVEVNREHKERVIDELTHSGRIHPNTLRGMTPRKETKL